jgi:hypothetical protein
VKAVVTYAVRAKPFVLKECEISELLPKWTDVCEKDYETTVTDLEILEVSNSPL